MSLWVFFWRKGCAPCWSNRPRRWLHFKAANELKTYTAKPHTLRNCSGYFITSSFSDLAKWIWSCLETPQLVLTLSCASDLTMEIYSLTLRFFVSKVCRMLLFDSKIVHTITALAMTTSHSKLEIFSTSLWYLSKWKGKHNLAKNVSFFKIIIFGSIAMV